MSISSCDYDDDMLICYFCDDVLETRSCYDISEGIHSGDSYNIKNGIVYCNDCEIYQEIYDKRICKLCNENRKATKLIGCDHTVCIKCFKKIYFGYTDKEKPCTVNEFYKKNITFNLNSPLWSRNTNFWKEYNYYIDQYMELNNIKNIEDIDIDVYKKQRPNLDYMPWWLENKSYTKWELTYIENKKKIKKIKEDYDEWMEEKDKNITGSFFTDIIIQWKPDRYIHSIISDSAKKIIYTLFVIKSNIYSVFNDKYLWLPDELWFLICNIIVDIIDNKKFSFKCVECVESNKCYTTNIVL